jgi:hypothetical protein
MQMLSASAGVALSRIGYLCDCPELHQMPPSANAKWSWTYSTRPITQQAIIIDPVRMRSAASYRLKTDLLGR